jgi:hypothetical protein
MNVMHHLGNHRLNHQLQRFGDHCAPTPARRESSGPRAFAHDMLVMSSRPDLTPEFPAGLRHPSQDDRTPSPLRLQP